MTASITGIMIETGPTWGLAEAEARFEDVVDRAMADGPQIIDGEEGALVVVSVEEWTKLTTGQADPESGPSTNADPTVSPPG